MHRAIQNDDFEPEVIFQSENQSSSRRIRHTKLPITEVQINIPQLARLQRLRLNPQSQVVPMMTKID